MTSSSSPPLQCGFDTMILVYSPLQGHSAATACEQLLRAHAGWFTSPWMLFEAKAVLTKVYGEDPALVVGDEVAIHECHHGIPRGKGTTKYTKIEDIVKINM